MDNDSAVFIDIIYGLLLNGQYYINVSSNLVDVDELLTTLRLLSYKQISKHKGIKKLHPGIMFDIEIEIEDTTSINSILDSSLIEKAIQEVVNNLLLEQAEYDYIPYKS